MKYIIAIALVLLGVGGWMIHKTSNSITAVAPQEVVEEAAPVEIDAIDEAQQKLDEANKKLDEEEQKLIQEIKERQDRIERIHKTRASFPSAPAPSVSQKR